MTRGSADFPFSSGPSVEPAGIVEVAALSGFSPATVSRALRGLPGVSAATRLAVQEAAARLGYVPSPSAAALTTGRTNAIGVMAPWVSRWFFSAVIEGIQEVLVHDGYDLLLYPVGEDGGRRPGGIDTRALSKRIDGLLAVTIPMSEASVLSLHELRVPVVTVGMAIEGMSGVLVDNVEVGRQATQLLIDLGHRRIAYFGDDLEEYHGFHVASDRHRGYDLALREAGLEPDPDLVQRTGFTVDGGEAATHRIFGPHRIAEPPTAIVAVSDEVAMGVLFAARDLGLKVPRDLSVVGVDGHDHAYLFDLTTVTQPVRDQGRIAARLLLEHVGASAPRAPSVVTVSATLVRRRSTGPISQLGSGSALPREDVVRSSSGRKSNGQKGSRLRSGNRAEPLAPAEVAVPPLS